jgi:hypothetical protein
MRPIDFASRRAIARDRGICAVCGRAFGAGAHIIATISRHAHGIVVHARAHVQCPYHLRLVTTDARAA